MPLKQWEHFMRKRSVLSVMFVAASLFLAGPAVAQAQVECGTTKEQWVGTFDGEAITYGVQHAPMNIEVIQNDAGALQVTTELDGTVYPTSGGYLAEERMSWLIRYAEGSFVPWTSFQTGRGEVTCSGGVVTDFTGYGYSYITGYGVVWTEDFELGRVG
ncbi:hypothetical protein [Actinophytocola sediminis]